jgi:hypothetical protein
MGLHNGISIALPYVTSTRGESERLYAKGFNPDIAIFPNCIVFSAVGLRC